MHVVLWQGCAGLMVRRQPSDAGRVPLRTGGVRTYPAGIGRLQGRSAGRVELDRRATTWPAEPSSGRIGNWASPRRAGQGDRHHGPGQVAGRAPASSTATIVVYRKSHTCWQHPVVFPGCMSRNQPSARTTTVSSPADCPQPVSPRPWLSSIRICWCLRQAATDPNTIRHSYVNSRHRDQR